MTPLRSPIVKNKRSRTLAAGTFQPKPYHNSRKVSAIRCLNIHTDVHKRNRFKGVPKFLFRYYFRQMISNQLNIIEDIDPEVDALRKLGNRVKTLRMQAGHYHYEKFAYNNN